MRWLLTLVGVLGCSRALPPDDPRMIAEWMQNYYGLIRAERVSPPVASRLMAYAAVALYEGLAVATPSLRSLAGQLNGLDSVPRPEAGKRYDATLTAIAAERTVLDTLFREGLPATRAALAALTDSLAAARAALGIPDAVQGHLRGARPADRSRHPRLGGPRRIRHDAHQALEATGRRAVLDQ